MSQLVSGSSRYKGKSLNGTFEQLASADEGLAKGQGFRVGV